ncbi:MAG: hypothetical protein ACREQX_17815 [Candidatus Binataceae bacterium]
MDAKESMPMDLAKQCVDVGIFTNKLEEMQAFYVGQVSMLTHAAADGQNRLEL